MPLYEYKCSSCEHYFNKMLSYDSRHEPEQESCPACGEVKVKYFISAPSIGYSHKGSMKTTDSFNDRMKEIKKKLPESAKGRINAVIR